jgi:hypothetical protein
MNCDNNLEKSTILNIIPIKDHYDIDYYDSDNDEVLLEYDCQQKTQKNREKEINDPNKPTKLNKPTLNNFIK